MPMVPASQLKRPVDEAYAFRLKPVDAISPLSAESGMVTHVEETARAVLVDGDADRFAKAVARWGGPEDVVDGNRPYEAPQVLFVEAPWVARLTVDHLRPVLAGRVRVMRRPGLTEYVLRDHHMLDVILHHYRTTGELPTAMLHADRHSDWCRDSYLDARRPEQAATWWSLVEGLKQPDGNPVMREHDVHFVTAKGKVRTAEGVRDVGAEAIRPWYLSAADVRWSSMSSREELDTCDWVSLDLDLFQPSAQLAATREILCDERFVGMLDRAQVIVYVLSPQFTRGGDRMIQWTVQGSLASSVRLLGLIRRQNS